MNWIVDHLFELSYGIKKIGNSTVYVSSGLSLWGTAFPYRDGQRDGGVQYYIQRVKMKVFIQSIVAQLLLNPYIFWRGYQALPPKKSCRIPFILFFLLELSLYFFGFIFRNELPDNVIITIQYICNTWYIASIYITLSLLVLELIRLSQRINHGSPNG